MDFLPTDREILAAADAKIGFPSEALRSEFVRRLTRLGLCPIASGSLQAMTFLIWNQKPKDVTELPFYVAYRGKT